MVTTLWIYFEERSPVSAHVRTEKEVKRDLKAFIYKWVQFAEIGKMVGGSGLGTRGQEFDFSHSKFRTSIRLPNCIIE